MGHVYKYTHIESGKWYIGSHNSRKERYSGSGLVWAEAKKKYGIEAFKKEILYNGSNYRNEEQRILEMLDAANDPMSYNLKNQALGGTFIGIKNGMYGKHHTPETKAKISKAFKGKPRRGTNNRLGKDNPNYRHGNQTKERYAELAALRVLLGKYHLRQTKECPHCGLIGEGPNMSRYHFDKCRKKNNEQTGH